MNERTRWRLLLLPSLGVADYPFDLGLHFLDCILPAAALAMTWHSKTDTSARPKRQNAGRSPALPTMYRAENLGVKVVLIRILRDKLRHLDPRDEVFVGLGHEVIVSRLMVLN